MIVEIPDDNSIKDLISREDLIRAIKTECNPYGAPTIDYESGLRVLEIIDRAPTVVNEKLTTERPQGEWERVRVDKTHYNYVCSECGYKAEFRKGNFCPNCGVQMIKEVKND